MNTSQETSKLNAAMAKARAEFDAIKKTSTATIASSKGSYQYTYADTAEILDCVIPSLSKHGLSLTSSSRYESLPLPQLKTEMLVCTVTTRLSHESGEWTETETTAPVAMPPQYDGKVSLPKPQEFGTAITFARRYGLGLILGVASEMDDDANGVQGHDNYGIDRRTNGNANSRPATPIAQPAPAPQQNRQPQANPVSDDKRAENAAKVYEIVKEYGNDTDIAAWDAMDKSDKMAAYRRACLNAKKVDPSFTAPV